MLRTSTVLIAFIALPVIALPVIGLAFFLAAENARPDPEVPAQSAMIVVGTGDLSDPCTVEISADIYPKLLEMGIDRWAEACSEASKQP